MYGARPNYTNRRDEFYKSLGDFLDNVDALPGNPPGDFRWRGAGDTWETTMKYARNGWPEGARRAREIAENISNRIAAAAGMVNQDVLSADVSGAAFDVGAIMQGVPEAWTRIEPVLQKKEIRIVTNVCASAGIDAETLKTRGLAVAGLALALQGRGFPVTVDCGWECGSNRDYTYMESCYVRLVDANYPVIDIDRIVFAMAHPGFFRYFLFAHSDKNKRGSLSNLMGGQVIEGFLPENLKEPSLYLGSAHLYEVQRWKDGGEAWIMEQFNLQTKEA